MGCGDAISVRILACWRSRTHARTHMLTCITHTLTYTHTNIYKQSYARAQTRTLTHLCTHGHIHSGRSTNTCTLTHTHITHIHMHTYTDTHTPLWLASGLDHHQRCMLWGRPQLGLHRWQGRVVGVPGGTLDFGQDSQPPEENTPRPPVCSLYTSIFSTE